MNLRGDNEHFDTHKGYLSRFIKQSAVMTISCFPPLGGAENSNFSSETIRYSITKDLSLRFTESFRQNGQGSKKFEIVSLHLRMPINMTYLIVIFVGAATSY